MNLGVVRSLANKYYTRTLKDGTIKRRIHDSITGRILRWEIADDLDEPQGLFKIREFTMNFIPTRESMKYTPSSQRDWEVRIRIADSDDLSDDDIEEYGREVLAELTNREMVDSSSFSTSKLGEDIIEYSNDDSIRWKVIDTIRPQYKYPKKKNWGDYSEI